MSISGYFLNHETILSPICLKCLINDHLGILVLVSGWLMLLILLKISFAGEEKVYSFFKNH